MAVDRDRQQGLLRGQWRAVLEASSVAAGVVYGFGWVLASRFYGRFHVSAEEVGVGVAFLTVRAVFLVSAFLALVMVLWLAIRWLADRAAGVELGPDSLRTVFLAVAGAVLSVVLLVVAILPVLVVVTGVVTGLLERRRSRRRQSTGGPPSVDTSSVDAPEPAARRSRSMRINGGTVLRAASVLFVGLALVLLVVAPFRAADELADRVEEGEDLVAQVLPGVAGIRAERVAATTTDGLPLVPGVPDNSCVVLLGTANEVVVLYDPDTDVTARVPVGRVSLRQPC